MAANPENLFATPAAPGPLALDAFEQRFWDGGFSLVAGVDEAGRGALAGPVVAAAVILPATYDCTGLDDSKKLTPSRRQELFGTITANATAWAVGVASAGYIDQVNVLNGALVAMKKACDRLAPRPDILLVDGNRRVPTTLPQRTIVAGDSRVASIAAASIIAKVYRDRLMVLLDAKYPGYGFGRHKGYGTQSHLRTLATQGPTPVHRRTFKPFAKRRQAPLLEG